MRKALVAGLRIAIPIALGVWLVWYFYQQLDERQREELFDAFRQAQWGWLVLSLLLGWASHMSRAWRWRYLLSPLGHQVGFWNTYHAVMAGYFMNLLLPRAGEASRAVILDRTERVPFEKGFGTILGERVVDLAMLALIGAITLALQVDKLELLQARVDAFRAGQGPADGDSAGSSWALALAAGILLLVLAGGYLLLSRPDLHRRLRQAVRGLYAGLTAVFRTPHKGWFLLHTLLIWLLYVAMFAVGFLALPETSTVPFAGVMAGFIAGSLGIVLVQGGIGVYPAFVALIVSVYMPNSEGDGLLQPQALAMGWLIWVAQTLMVIVLGGLSLLLTARHRKPVPA